MYRIGRTLLLVIALGLCCLAPRHGSAANPALTESVIDVGQGDAILVEFPNGKDMLVDAGPPGAGAKVVSCLKQRGVKRIDILVESHPHADHIGGMQAVLKAFPVGEVWESGYHGTSALEKSFERAVTNLSIQEYIVSAGHSEKEGEATISVLAPVKLLKNTGSDANNNSVVIRVDYGATSTLLTGDQEAKERATVTDWKPVTLLKTAHHGSRTGVDMNWIKRVQPKLVAISCGKGNKYKHPHNGAMVAFKSVGAEIHRTDKEGTLAFVSDGSKVAVAE